MPRLSRSVNDVTALPMTSELRWIKLTWQQDRDRLDRAFADGAGAFAPRNPSGQLPGEGLTRPGSGDVRARVGPATGTAGAGHRVGPDASSRYRAVVR